MIRERDPERARPGGFTLLELLVSITILVVMVLLIANIIGNISSLTLRSRAQINSFQSARNGFELMTHTLAQATLNTYWDYQYAPSSNPPTPIAYIRQSQLAIWSGSTAALLSATMTCTTQGVFFQAPLGYSADQEAKPLENMLNMVGFFVQFGSDKSQWPPFLASAPIPQRWRYRLMELCQPAENNRIYSTKSGNYTTPYTYWITGGFLSGQLTPNPVQPVADNVVALVLLPHLSPEEDPSGVLITGNTTYTYNSRLGYTYTNTLLPAAAQTQSTLNQLPPLYQVVMVVIDEPSAIQLSATAGTTAPNLGQASLFKSPPNLEADLTTLENTLTSKHLNYRVFRTDVSIRGAKWSNDQ